MEIDIAVLADAANVTADGKVNVLGIFREFNPLELPIVLPTFSIAISLTAEPNELGTSHTLDVILNDVNGDISKTVTRGGFTIPNRLNYDYPMVNFIIGVQNLQIGVPGTYYFEVILDNLSVKRIPFLVAEPLNNSPKLLNPS